MSEPIPPIEHLVFSTRAARPRSGSEFNREVVACSPGMPEAARRELARLADMTGPVLARPELPPLWAFRRLDSDSWLLARAVSLGLYRKGHHQLLVHGVVLPRALVDLLDGNPFLLDSPEARAAGFRFAEEHPGDESGLAPLRLTDDAGLAAFARRENARRLEGGAERFPDLDPIFPDLYDHAIDAVRRSRERSPEAGDEPAPLALVLPDHGPGEAAGAIEWLLLHLHPADRAEVSFHTTYAYEQATPFDWIGAETDDLPGLRRQLRGLATWSAGEAPIVTPGAEPTLGARVRQVRDRAPGLLPRALETYYLTVVPSRFGSDVRRKPFHPLEPDDAALCLRATLGLPVTEAEEKRLVRFSLRGDQGLSRHVGDLGNAWRRGPAAFEGHLARLTAEADDLRSIAPADAGDLARLSGVTEPEERFGLLALARRLLTSDLEPLARSLAPPRELGAVLALFRSPEERAVGERELAPWADAWIEDAGGLTEPGHETAPAWELWLRWLHHAGRPVAPVAGRIERAILEGSESAPAAAGDRLPALRRLQRVCADVGLESFGLRLLFQREIPRLPAAAARVRWADGVAALLRGADATAAAYPFLAPALDDPESAPIVLDAVADFVARWTADPQASENDLAAVLDRLAALGPGEEPAIDRVLLAAALPALVLSEPGSGSGARLRAAVARQLARLLDGGRLHRALETDGAAGPWRHLLLDELLATPPVNPGDDPRYRAAIELGWRRWAAEVDRPGAPPVVPAAVALARVLPFPGSADPGERWHRTALEHSVDPPLRAEAGHLLSALLCVQ